MSVVIIGGNECMERQYKDVCKSYHCDAKVFIKPAGSLKNKLGNPDMVIFFTNTMSHKLLRGTMSEIKGKTCRIEHCKTGSVSALRSILSMASANASAHTSVCEAGI